MDEIYKLVGQVLESFQKLEERLSLIIYQNAINWGDDFVSKNAIKQVKEIDKATFGQIVAQIKNKRFLESEQDFIVLEYLRGYRNYLAHSFFIDEQLATKEQRVRNIEKLRQLKKDVVLVTKAVGRYIISNQKDR